MTNYSGLAGAAARSSAGGKNYLSRLGHLLTRREIGHVTRVRDRCNSLWFSAMQGPELESDRWNRERSSSCALRQLKSNSAIIVEELFYTRFRLQTANDCGSLKTDAALT
jgi:hypothetical protein